MYGYELGVPLDWSAYEDIAEFFSVHVKEIDGVRIYGHMDYGKRAPDLGWRMTDAWLSMAGASSKGLPNGRPIDEWGIRMEEGSCNPSGASVSRGGETNGPASVYAIRKWDEWLRKFAPPGAADYDFYQSLPALSQGNVAQQIFWYTAFTAEMVKPKSEGNNTIDKDGNLLWRMAPSPQGPVLGRGHEARLPGRRLVDAVQVDAARPAQGGLALCASSRCRRRVSLKKSHVGLTIIRDSDIRHASFTERAPKLGGLVEFYRSPDRVRWTPTGINVPDYPKLAQLWWQNIGDVNSGAFTPQQAMDRLAKEMDERDGAHGGGRQEGEGLWRLRPAAQCREEPERMARQAERPEGQAREREAEGPDHRLRRAGEALEIRQGLSRAETERGRAARLASGRSCDLSGSVQRLPH